MKLPYLFWISAAALLSAGAFGPGGAQSGIVRLASPFDGEPALTAAQARADRLPAVWRDAPADDPIALRMSGGIALADHPDTAAAVLLPLILAQAGTAAPAYFELEPVAPSRDTVGAVRRFDAPRAIRPELVAPAPFILTQSGGEQVAPPAASPPAASQPAPAPPAEASRPPPEPVPVAPAQPPAAAPAQAAAASGVDETALRYFARQGDQKRLQQEIARLRALYPDWTPPANPLAIPAATDPLLDAMWQLYSEGRFADVRKAVADRQLAEPAWTAPQDLLQRLDVAEARERLINASNLKQYNTVVRVGADTPSLLTCSDVDVLWRVAEALALTDRADRARDAYTYILKNCDDPAERLATVEKAIPLLPRETVELLLDTERTGTDGKGEFAKARADIIRHAVSTVQNDPQQRAEASDLAALRTIAEQEGLASDALLLGWYYLRHENPTAAAEWFGKAREREDTAEAAQGLALALIALNRSIEAEAALFEWRNETDETKKVYLAAAANMLGIEPPVEIDVPVLQRIVAAAVENRDVATGQQLGWYARAFNQHETAGRWFTTALQWNPDDEPSAYGLALTRQQLGDRAGVAEIQQRWAGRSERIAQLGETHRRTGGTEQPSPQPRGASGSSPLAETAMAPAASAPASASARRSSAGGSGVAARVERLPERRNCARAPAGSVRSGEAALAHAWCLMDLNRPIEAAASFQAAMAGGSEELRREAAWGQSLAYLRKGLTDQAALAAIQTRQDTRRTQELQIQILTQRATGFFEAGRYVEALYALDQRARITPERLDLMSMRGYAYLQLGRVRDAERVFRALADAGSRDGIRGLGAVDRQVHGE